MMILTEDLVPKAPNAYVMLNKVQVRGTAAFPVDSHGLDFEAMEFWVDKADKDL